MDVIRKSSDSPVIWAYAGGVDCTIAGIVDGADGGDIVHIILSDKVGRGGLSSEKSIVTSQRVLMRENATVGVQTARWGSRWAKVCFVHLMEQGSQRPTRRLRRGSGIAGSQAHPEGTTYITRRSIRQKLKRISSRNAMLCQRNQLV